MAFLSPAVFNGEPALAFELTLCCRTGLEDVVVYSGSKLREQQYRSEWVTREHNDVQSKYLAFCRTERDLLNNKETVPPKKMRFYIKFFECRSYDLLALK